MTEIVETMVFDPCELFAQLSRLLKLYLERAGEEEALAKLAPKDALAAAKTIFELMAALQSGKLAAVDEDTDWPRIESITAESAGRHVPATCPGGSHGFLTVGDDGQAHVSAHPLIDFEAAVARVCQFDEETAALEPYARLVARINRLSDIIEADLEAMHEAAPDQEDQPPARLSAEEFDDKNNGKNRAFPKNHIPRGP